MGPNFHFLLYETSAVWEFPSWLNGGVQVKIDTNKIDGNEVNSSIEPLICLPWLDFEEVIPVFELLVNNEMKNQWLTLNFNVKLSVSRNVN